ncbi:MAG: hypothetical protein JWQ04_443 [Pedosphaera sp.]|nr:hypothetical protein [Pedosphaera sp.]
MHANNIFFIFSSFGKLTISRLSPLFIVKSGTGHFQPKSDSNLVPWSVCPNLGRYITSPSLAFSVVKKMFRLRLFKGLDGSRI